MHDIWLMRTEAQLRQFYKQKDVRLTEDMEPATADFPMLVRYDETLDDVIRVLAFEVQRAFDDAERKYRFDRYLPAKKKS